VMEPGLTTLSWSSTQIADYIHKVRSLAWQCCTTTVNLSKACVGKFMPSFVGSTKKKKKKIQNLVGVCKIFCVFPKKKVKKIKKRIWWMIWKM
jgi:hypothetical protein